MIHNPCSTWQYKWLYSIHFNIFDLCSLVEFCCILVKDMSFFSKDAFFETRGFIPVLTHGE